LSPVPQATSRAAMAAGRAGERMAERVVPQIMERGGMPAGLLESMSQGAKSNVITEETLPILKAMTKEQFLGKPKIVGKSDAADLKPVELKSLQNVEQVPFLDKYTAKFSEDGAVVFDKDKPIASYNFGDTLTVDKKYRGQGIGEELVYQWRTSYPAPAVASTRNKMSQALQEKVWERIQKDIPENDGLLTIQKRNNEVIVPTSLLRGLPGLKTPAPQEEALRLAQQRAALPVEQGGLGLPKDNTPMDRARAMGFESGWAHGSPRSDITELRSSRIGAQGPGAYATNYLPEASTYSGAGEGATVYPLMVRRSEAINTKFNNPYDELGVNADDELLSELFGRGKSAIVTTQEKTPDWLLKAGAPDMPERQHFVSVRPENFRSRFAAFDPFRRTAAIAATMGVAAPDLLARTIDDEERRRQLLSGLLGP
jgi:GNAT superfamily N-acetyltransferase